ncbi:hypothetical protein H4W00_000325 [Psychrobacter sp. PL19]|uniref:hypothetical protein n=1 Tax=Psychrobacter sp. PL19 TaxID=2760711 RepID=UPI001AE566B2
MWNNNLQTLLVGITMAAGISLSACDGSKKEVVQEEEIASDTTSAQPAVSEPVPASPDLDGADVDQGTPVSYDISTWSSNKVKPLKIDELDRIKSTFGKVVGTDENSLDYASNTASKYRFMAADAPYLDLVDSEKYLELGWYYANPTDSDKEKEVSRDHAKKSYKLARQLMSDDGGKLIADILNGQIIKNKTIGEQKVELAKCEFYSCMLVLNKSGVKADDS